MSKKLLNETTIRRFAALSGIRADVVSNFINESEWQQAGEEVVSEEEEAEEEMEADEMDAEADMMGDEEAGDEEAGDEDMEMDMDLGGEEAGEEDDAQGLVQSIVDQLQQLAQMAGVDMDVEEPEGDAGDMEMDMELGGEEETLEEILDGILAEEAEEETLEEAEEEDEVPPAKREGGYMQEDLVQEVLKRVKARLTQLSQQ